MIELVEILQVAYHAGASDVHLTVGIAPTMRLNGHLVKMDYPVLKPEDTLELCLDVLNPVQREKFEERGVHYLFSDFKKKGGYYRSIALSTEYGLYRQDFCGCKYSKR